MNSVTPSQLTTIASVAQAVEQTAATAVAVTGTAPTSAQKLQAAIGIAQVVDPSLTSTVTPLEEIFASVVAMLHLFGVFSNSTATTAAQIGAAAAASAPAPTTATPVTTTATVSAPATLADIPVAPAPAVAP